MAARPFLTVGTLTVVFQQKVLRPVVGVVLVATRFYGPAPVEKVVQTVECGRNEPHRDFVVVVVMALCYVTRIRVRLHLVSE